MEAFEHIWAQKYPKIGAKWMEKSYALLESLNHPKPIRPYLYTTNQLERLIKELKRRVKVAASFVPRRWKSSYTWCWKKRIEPHSDGDSRD